MSVLGLVFGQCKFDARTRSNPTGTHPDMCSDFGDKHPGTEVIGIDLSPIQPNWVPPNVQL